MTPKQKLFDLAEKHGIEVDFEPDIQWLQFWSPRGKLFCSSGCHIDAEAQNLTTEKSMDWPACLELLQQIIDSGFVDCDEPNCETCNLDGSQ